MILDRRALILSSLATAGLAGCADIVGPPEPPKLYRLSPRFAAVPGPSVPWALSVLRPETAGSFETERLVLTRPPSGLDFYANTAWSDRTPNLIQTALVEAFEASGRIAQVARDSDGIRADYLLNTDLRDFEARYDQGEGAPLAVIRLAVRLMETRGRRIVGTAVFAKEVRASANTVDAVVAAHTEAFSGLAADLVPWVLKAPMPK
ncbi:cholesterol transport system auxiliary component [Rhizomicrobium palustre]|uniref:Cholesterol transport system auxiliary component n=1 Tax=Rhizomicrobium palustre TaxID=189966 RepID=A0A846MVM8_9PROT|nr:ABC-type transport auxiliary lipoprotein family protein [Rhizomicrobium palustre]NIK87269.1 cholesterol transport system auxiliary component [Rhizomicrobium palustre]